MFSKFLTNTTHISLLYFFSLRLYLWGSTFESAQESEGGDFVPTFESAQESEGGDFVPTFESAQESEGGDFVPTFESAQESEGGDFWVGTSPQEVHEHYLTDGPVLAGRFTCKKKSDFIQHTQLLIPNKSVTKKH